MKIFRTNSNIIILLTDFVQIEIITSRLVLYFVDGADHSAQGLKSAE